MLRVSVLGHLGGDAQLRTSVRGTPIASFSVAVNQTRTGADGKPEETTEWFRVNVAGRQSAFAAQLKRGQRVLAIGRLQIARFTRQDGSPRVGFDVWADEIQNVSGRSAAADGEDGATAVGAAVNTFADEPADLDDLPF
jgi:single-strand DNA-binding protein